MIIHQAVLELNEEGAEAAAVTAVMVKRSSMIGGPKPFRMVVDRPFFCAIQDNESGAALFMGAIYDPEG
jgi:serpin B